MRVVIQRVRKAQVTIEENTREQIGQGILVLLGIEMADVQADVDWLINKVLNLRIFDDVVLIAGVEANKKSKRSLKRIIHREDGLIRKH